MFYTVYKITNKLNGKYYIGKHQTENLHDGYMGSGKLLKRAVAKHGIKNFTKEILHIFDAEAAMNAKEKELVTISEETYNLTEGGCGGFSYIIKNGLQPPIKLLNDKRLEKMTNNSEFKASMIRSSRKGYEIAKTRGFSGNSHNSFLGKHHTEESKTKISATMKGRIPWNKP